MGAKTEKEATSQHEIKNNENNVRQPSQSKTQLNVPPDFLFDG
jgi:hypothetical protein